MSRDDEPYFEGEKSPAADRLDRDWYDLFHKRMGIDRTTKALVNAIAIELGVSRLPVRGELATIEAFSIVIASRVAVLEKRKGDKQATQATCERGAGIAEFLRDLADHVEKATHRKQVDRADQT